MTIEKQEALVKPETSGKTLDAKMTQARVNQSPWGWQSSYDR
jgi:hypothetical protein